MQIFFYRPSDFEIKVLDQDDSEAFRILRLEALERDGRCFAASLEEERSHSLSYWAEQCRPCERGFKLGLFARQKLVGITSAQWNERDTLLFGGSYIQRPFRLQKLSYSLYQSRIFYARAWGVKRAYVFHRHDNRISQHINVRHGAVYSHTQPMHWADGAVADGVWYSMSFC